MIGSVYVTNFKKILGIAFCSMFTERTGSYIVSLYVSFFFVLQNWSMAQITTDNSPKSNANCPTPCEYTRYDTTLSCGSFPAAFLEPYFSKLYNISQDKI